MFVCFFGFIFIFLEENLHLHSKFFGLVLQASHSQAPSLFPNSAQQCVRRMQNVGRWQQNEDAALLHLAVLKWNGSNLIHVLGTGKEKKMTCMMSD